MSVRVAQPERSERDIETGGAALGARDEGDERDG
jgi:hypothetical protein